MNILIFGASGLVGSAIHRVLSDDYNVHGVFNKNAPENYCDETWHKCDISDIARVNELLSSTTPELIISSLTGDFQQQTTAHKVMAEYLNNTGGRMIFISTANVFDGATGGNHSENASPYPLSQYGDFKKNCEEMLRKKLGSKCLVARLPKITSKDDATKIAQHISQGKGFYKNLFFNYNTPENVAAALKYCIEKNKSGVVHLVSHDYIADDEQSKQILAKAGLQPDFQTHEFTPESYCALMGHNDTSKLRPSNDGNFYLTMTCTDVDINANFSISCSAAIQ